MWHDIIYSRSFIIASYLHWVSSTWWNSAPWIVRWNVMYWCVGVCGGTGYCSSGGGTGEFDFLWLESGVGRSEAVGSPWHRQMSVSTTSQSCQSDEEKREELWGNMADSRWTGEWWTHLSTFTLQQRWKVTKYIYSRYLSTFLKFIQLLRLYTSEGNTVTLILIINTTCHQQNIID